jgi:hypothetical protein
MDDFATAILDRLRAAAMRAAGRDERMGSARGPNKRIRKKGRKKEEFEARFVLDIETRTLRTEQ